MKNYLNWKNLSWLLFTVTIYFIVSVLMQAKIINAYYQITLMTICINIILAVGLNLIIGICGQFSLGHAGFMCIGAYTCAVMTKFYPGYGGMLAGILLGFVISGIVALIVAIPTLRLKGDYLAIATLGFAEIIRIVVLNMDITNRAAGLSNIPKLVTWPLIYFGVVITVLTVVNFGRSAPGRACISIREDEIASEAMGINTTKYKTIAFLIGALLASLAGAFYASTFYVIKPETFGFAKSIDILVIVVFGGMGSVTGSILSGIALGIINTVLQSFSAIRMILYAVTIVLIMIFRPKGLLGTKEFTFTGLYRFIRGRFKHESSKSN
ncbi:MAG: branched-chain amino acid ABC transporter permease [Erysipelotrichaceae bacterium]|nr:branched-chain amino acid ABC transporter permease [Erysipelotrichaceae bacterium]